MDKKEIGKISHFFGKISVAAIDLTGELKIGDKISIESDEKKIEMTVESMQVSNNSIEEAKSGDSVGIKVPERVHVGNKVYKIEE